MFEDSYDRLEKVGHEVQFFCGPLIFFPTVDWTLIGKVGFEICRAHSREVRISAHMLMERVSKERMLVLRASNN